MDTRIPNEADYGFHLLVVARRRLAHVQIRFFVQTGFLATAVRMCVNVGCTVAFGTRPFLVARCQSISQAPGLTDVKSCPSSLGGFLREDVVSGFVFEPSAGIRDPVCVRAPARPLPVDLLVCHSALISILASILCG